jgi:glycosyltransferase involved in cell wall biosynthesis
MTVKNDGAITVYFLSFVEPNYSRSSTLLNAESTHLKKEYLKVSPKWRSLIIELLSIKKSLHRNSIILVMSPAQKITPIARIILKQKIILDAGWPLTDGVLSRGLGVVKIPRLIGSYLMDLIAFHSSNLILVESKLQLQRVSRNYSIPRSRLKVSYTGVNEIAFSKHFMPTQDFVEWKEVILRKPKKLNVIFRGAINNEAGIETILIAADVLVNELNLVIIADRKRLPEKIPSNCFVFNFVSEEEMRELYRFCDVALGQISENERLNYTIPHKAFEAGYFAKTYITPRVGGIAEIYSLAAVYFLDEVNVRGLVEALKTLYDKEIRFGFEQQIQQEYNDNLSQPVIASRFEKEVRTIMGSSIQ